MNLASFWRAARWIVVLAWVSTMDDGCAVNTTSVVHAITDSVVISGR